MSTHETDPGEISSVTGIINVLENSGWVVGRNLAIDYRWAAGDPRRMQEYALELVALAPDVIFAKGATVPQLASVTSTIPIVFAMFDEAAAKNYIKSYSRPEGNITGFASSESTLAGKRIQILKAIFPRMTRVLYIRSARNVTRPVFLRLLEDASQLGLAVSECAAENETDIERAVASFAQEPDGGISVAFDAFNTVHRQKLVDLAARYRLPAIYFFRFFVDSGGLVSYGFNQAEQFRQAATYVDRILKGEKPGDLPVQLPTKYQLVINLKTAKTLGLSVPPTLIGTADEVVE